MPSVKESARDVIERLRDDATWDDLMYELYVKQRIDRGIADVEAQRVIPHERVRAELLKLTARAHRPWEVV